MFPEFIAGLYMAMQIKFHDAELPYIKQQSALERQLELEHKAKKKELKEKYEKSKFPESGFMLKSEYEEKSFSKDKMLVEIGDAKTVSDSNMKYVPVPEYRIVKYNSSPGFTELQIPRRLNYDREVTGQGIVSSDFTFMVYPALRYYASADCTTTDLYVIPLDDSLSKLERVKRANIIRRGTAPILSTEKNIETPYIFRTLTPVDFTPDNKKLLIKEKVGHRFDGIWKTDLLVYDFELGEVKELFEVRDAIINHWLNTKGVNLNEHRWDIYPLGIDENNVERVILSAYAYTGKNPLFLGIWSVDLKGENPRLESLNSIHYPIKLIGYKIEYAGNKSREIVESDEKLAEKQEKKSKKDLKKTEKERLKRLEREYKNEMYKLDKDYLNKVRTNM